MVDGELGVLLLLVKEEHGVGLAGLDVLYPTSGATYGQTKRESARCTGSLIKPYACDDCVQARAIFDPRRQKCPSTEV